MAQAAKKQDAPAPTEQDTLDAVEKFSSAMQVFQRKAEEERREKIAEAMAGPVATPSEVLVRDPATGERLVFYAATKTQFLKIGFKLMRRAELKRVPENQRLNTCVDWPQQAKVQIVMIIRFDHVGQDLYKCRFPCRIRSQNSHDFTPMDSTGFDFERKVLI